MTAQLGYLKDVWIHHELLRDYQKTAHKSQLRQKIRPAPRPPLLTSGGGDCESNRLWARHAEVRSTKLELPGY